MPNTTASKAASKKATSAAQSMPSNESSRQGSLLPEIDAVLDASFVDAWRAGARFALEQYYLAMNNGGDDPMAGLVVAKEACVRERDQMMAKIESDTQSESPAAQRPAARQR